MPESNVQELIIKYKADISDLQSKVAQIEVALRKGGQTGEAAGKKITDSFKKADSQATGLGAKVKSALSGIAPIGDQFVELGKNIVGAFAVQQVIAFGVASIKSFQEAQLNAIQLRNAVSVNGGLQEDFEKLIAQADELQKKTIFSKNEVENAQKIALQFGLTTAEVEKLLPVITDFASATGQELGPALQAVIGGVNGNARALRQYGVVVDAAKSKSENLASIQEQLNKKFAGQAVIVGETSAGAFKKLGNQIDDIKEGIGGFLSDVSEGSATLLSFALNGFRPLNEEIEATGKVLFKTTEELEKFQRTATSATVAALVIQIEKLKNADVDVTHLVSQLNALKNAQVKLEVTGLSDTQLIERRKELEKMPFLLKEQSDALKLINEEIKKRNLDFIIAEKDLTKLTTDELERRRVVVEQANKETNSQQLQQALEAIDEELARRKEANKKATDELVKAKQDASKRLADIDKKLNDELLQARGQTEVEKLRVQQGLLEEEVQSTFSASLRTVEDEKNRDEAVLSLRETFGIKIRQAQEKIDSDLAKQRIEALKNEQETIRSGFDSITDEAEVASLKAQAALKEQFLQSGDFSPEALQKLDDELLKIEEESNNIRSQNAKDFADKFVAQQERIQEAVQKNAKLAEQKVVVDFVLGGDFSPSAFVAMNARIAKLQVDANNQTKKLADESKAVQAKTEEEITQNKIDNINARLAVEKAAAEQEAQLAQKRQDLEKEILNTAIDGVQQLITNAINRETDAKLDSAQKTSEAEIDAINDSISANDDKLRRGIIGDREAQKNKEQLLQQKKQAEEKAAAAERAIKREQFKNDQLAAIAKVIIANIINAAEFPALAELYAGLAIIQTGLILAEPNPYKKGSKKTKSGLAIVGEEGPELMMLPSDGKVLSTGKTKKKKHADVIDAMFDDRLDEYIQQYYVQPEIKKLQQSDDFDYSELSTILSRLQISPQLKAAEQKYKVFKNEQFAMNIANSFMLNKEFGGLSGSDFTQRADEIRRKGTYIRNAHEITEPILDALLTSRSKSRLRR